MDNRLIHTPEGVRDIYGVEYAKKLSLEDALNKCIRSFGYMDIQTPSFEFFDVFSKEIGTNPSRELYKFFDKENNTLVLRPDFTPGIARSAAKYFLDETLPIRLTYLGNVFNNINDHQGKLKEVTQIGAECIGEPTVAADAEMIALLVACLKKAGLSEFQISIGQVEYFKGICEALKIDEETEMALREQISGKNIFAVHDILSELELSEEAKLQISGAADLLGGVEILDKAESLVNNSRSKEAVKRLRELYSLLEVYGVSKYVTFDLGMLSKYHYYTGIIFRAYTYGVGEPVAKGGRYDGLLSKFGKSSAAIGVGIVVDQLYNALMRQHIKIAHESKKAILVYAKEDLAKAITFADDYRKKDGKIELVPMIDGNTNVNDYIAFGSKDLVDEIYICQRGTVIKK